MKYAKVKGILEVRKGTDSGRIKVIAFKRDNRYVNDLEEIKNEFSPHGYVFAPSIFKNYEYGLDTILEFTAAPATNSAINGDDVIMDNYYDCKRIGVQVFQIDNIILDNPSAINQPALRSYMHEIPSSHFYIKNNDILYGPFKSVNDEVIPLHGKEVYKYGTIPETYICGNKYYFLEEPVNIIETIDCRTPAQLVDWFKKLIQTLSIKVDVSLLHQLQNGTEMDVLNSARLQRLLKQVDIITLTRNELEELASNSERFKTMYQNALDNIRNEFEKELIVPVSKKKQLLNEDCSKLQDLLDRRNNDYDVIAKNVESTKKQYEFIVKEKDRLIEEIKVQTLVLGNNISEKPGNEIADKLFTFEEQIYDNKCESFVDLAEFAVRYIEIFGETAEMRGKGKRLLFQLKDYRCLLCKNIELIQQFARLSNNCKLFMQQVEPDWLKFECLYKNGLKQIWESAHKNSDIIHFLVLEDMNMASIECYGKPLLDMLAGLRHKLPGLHSKWPDNFWIFGVPLEHNDELSFGLPLIKSTFKNWGAFPFFELLNNVINADLKYLPVSALFNHDSLVTPSIEDYFL